MGLPAKAGGAAAASLVMFGQLLLDRTSDKQWPLAIRNRAYGILQMLIESVGITNTEVVYINKAAIDPEKKYICGMHPHGALCLGALSWGCKTKNGDPPVGRFCCVADVLLKLPVIGTLLHMGEGRSVSQKNVEKLLAKDASIAIWPGGIFEQLNTSHEKEVVYFQPNKGLIRMAMKFGVDLLPTYVFGENQIFKMQKGTGKPIQANYYVAPSPSIDWVEFLQTVSSRKKDIKVVMGEPIPVEQNTNPTDEEVDVLFNLYIDGLEKTFYMYADQFLPKEVTDRKLHIIMRQPPKDVRPRSKL